MNLLLKYGTSATVYFNLYDFDDPRDGEDSASHASGDITIGIDGGTPGASTNGFVSEGGNRYSLVLTSGELTGGTVQVLIRDQTNPKVWVDHALNIETYGHASARHPFDLGTPGATTEDLAASVWDALLANHDDTNSFGARIAQLALESTSQSLDGTVTTIAANVSEILTDTGTTLPGTLSTIGSNVGDIRTVTEKLDDTLEDASGWRFTEAALEEAPTGGSASAVWEHPNRTLTSGTGIVLAKGTGITGFNDLSTSQVNAEVDVALADLFTAPMPDSVPVDGVIPTPLQALYMLVQFMLERQVSGTTVAIKKPDGTTTLFSLTVNDPTSPSTITRTS